MISQIMNCQEMKGYGLKNNCVTFCIWAITSFTQKQALDKESYMESERFLAKFQGQTLISMMMKHIVVYSFALASKNLVDLIAKR